MRTGDTRRRILEAALLEFAGRAYESASLNDILADAGASKGSFYHHFQNKEDLYRQVLLEALDAKNRFLAQRVGEAQPASIGEFVAVNLGAGLEFAASHPTHQQLADTYGNDATSPVDPGWLASRAGSEGEAGLQAAIESSRQRGDISGDHSDEFVVGVIGLVFGHFARLFPRIDPSDRSAVRDAVLRCAEFLEKGLR